MQSAAGLAVGQDKARSAIFGRDRPGCGSVTTTAVFGPRGVMRQSIAVKIGAVHIEPHFCALHVWTQALHQTPEPLRVVHLDKMRDLVGGEIVEHEVWGEYKPPGKRQDAGGRA